ncbi:glycoside hydrolase [Pseudomassariella vexata]|uniref:lytic cellulose monooxygenase (C4-dehydrogenating) n=1 Tax=Pseudomassariella vexata TaxID=1141098 RepID=A0A1Y2E8F9_9PEZI|nr:glycoside hydrolase [Pseudomassariella vexata]ORY67566.1 glycoside hydrolase [Pseudomassariella vexata]
MGILALAITASAAPHYTFPKIAGTSDWTAVRKTKNFQTNGPVTDVNSPDIRCYQLAAGNEGATTQPFKAGSTITWVAAPNIYHVGALSAYMAKTPVGTKAEDWDGAGAVWFKIFQDMPTVSGGQYNWPSNGKEQVSFTIPPCIEDGEYMFRVEHVALHSAAAEGGAQFYLSCAQLSITGGSGSKKPTDLVSFPGAYKATDPGLMINIYNNGGKPYTPAGPPVFTC